MGINNDWPKWGSGPYTREQLPGGHTEQLVGDGEGMKKPHYGEGVNVAILDVHGPGDPLFLDVPDHARLNALNVTTVAPSATVQFFPHDIDPLRLPTIEQPNIVDKAKAFFVQNFTSRESASNTKDPINTLAVEATERVTEWLKYFDKLNEDDNPDNDIDVIAAPIAASNASVIKAIDVMIENEKLDPKIQSEIFGDTDPSGLDEIERMKRINAYVENQYKENPEWKRAREEYADAVKDASEEASILIAAGNEHGLIPEEVGADEMNYLARATSKVLAVGAANDELNGPAIYASRGGEDRNPDVLAFGRFMHKGDSFDNPIFEFFGGPQGSSYAIPIAAGTAAAVLSENPELTPDKVNKIIIDGAEAIPGFSEKEIGKGIITNPFSIIDPDN